MQAQAVVLLSLLSFVLILYSLGLKVPMPGTFHSYLKFAYGSFFKPHTGDGSGNQQDALESFYEYQADAYDTTRTTLLRGRDDMIRLVAAQLRHRKCSRKPVWIDIGGGTGWNIEQMGKHIDVPGFFDAIYLVDLTPSLLKVAETRFQKLGWTNVHVVCMDCRYFDLSKHGISDSKRIQEADLVTMSYSLTMIPDFFAVVDNIARFLAPVGIIGVVDFYAQTEVEFMRRDYIGGFLDRHCGWLNRTFWRTWFEQDRVMFDGGRRDYLEYRFGTILNINKRNAMLPGLRIPFYLWIGCPKSRLSTGLDDSVVKTSFLGAPDGLTRPDIPLPSVYYQNHGRRTYYDAELKSKKQDSSSTKENHKDDSFVVDLALTSNDIVLAPSDDTLLSCLNHEVKTVHAYDPNPADNHLLELKVAALETLSPDKCGKLFTQAGCSNFREILMDTLSPHMSSQAVQYWLNYGSKGWLAGSDPRPILPPVDLLNYGALLSALETEKLRIHTAALEDVLARTTPGSWSVVITRQPLGLDKLQSDGIIHLLSQALSIGGRVVVESAVGSRSCEASLEKAGFVIGTLKSGHILLTKVRS